MSKRTKYSTDRKSPIGSTNNQWLIEVSLYPAGTVSKMPISRGGITMSKRTKYSTDRKSPIGSTNNQ
ncbi:hypothetical protein [Lysinibacillus parviboronicapiens]|uniref:hypothetical protein n=1 Tax=Lysinibacillus parviboronicapiens TaxID=436516 RepID=UPI00142E3652|nr:hypothetical protein [Lysinibacillus parviboronicapiens]